MSLEVCSQLHHIFCPVGSMVSSSSSCKKNIQMYLFRSSCPDLFCKKVVLKNFTKFTGKHLCQSLFVNKVAGLRPATFFKKSLWRRCLSVNFAKISKTIFFFGTPPVATSVCYRIQLLIGIWCQGVS